MTQPAQNFKAPTIYDVAEAAGVSKSLVSLVLRGESNVSEARKKAVLSAIEDLGYRPSRFAQQLASSRTRSIGVLITDYKNLSYLGFLKGLREIFDDSGYQVLISDLHRSPNFDEDPIDAFASMKVDGLVIATEVGGLRTHKLDIPMIMIGQRETKIPTADVVFNDDYEGSRLALEHLIELGHKHIVHLTGVGGIAINRRKAYSKIMKAAGLGGLIFGEGQPTTEIGGYLAALECIKSKTKFTAIYAANDYIAAGAWSALRENGLQVPQDVSIIGYDNSPISSDYLLKFSTIDEQGTAVGRQAAVMMLERIGTNGPYTTESVLIKPTIVLRSSTANPKSGK